MLLNCHTYYSFCYGTLSVDELLSLAKQAGHSCIAVTDINNTSACLDLVRKAKEEYHIKPILGIDFRNGAQQCYVGIAMNNQGFKELNDHLSLHLHGTIPFEEKAPEFNNAYVIYPLKNYKGRTLRENEFIGVSVKELESMAFVNAQKHTKKFVAQQPVTFTEKKFYNAHRLLRAIDTNNLLSKLPLSEQANADELLYTHQELYFAYASYANIISNTAAILNSCTIDFTYGKFANKNLKYFTTSLADDMNLLRSKCMENLSYRYTHPTPEVMKRIEKELDIIQHMNFASYFLINWDIVKYAQHKDYYYVGRGSGANSIVAYLLRITDVDPIDLDLYFERFINPARTNPPDFDIDFSWTDRDDITRYMFDTYGHKRTALLGAYNTFQKDAVIRELGKVFGLPVGEIDRLQTTDISAYKNLDSVSKMVLRYSGLIKGFPSHLSIHSSGIIISQEEITNYSATSMPPKGYPTTQFSMLEAEDIGLYKFDILSQRGLAKIKDAIQIVKENQGVQLDMHKVSDFKDDERIKELLREGKTIGCFYVESPAMRMLLSKLRADDYLRLVAASSIIRPGVSKSGMMREYIIRFRNEHLRKKARETLPVLYDLLEETYGVMVYQEDVIKVAHLFADLTLTEADYLRRGMSWKFKQRNEFHVVKEKFFNNCAAKGYNEKLVTDIWVQIESFANFAFSKGHSASYAVESYQALYIKAYYPIEYMVATLNNGGGFYRKELYLHEARLQGASVVLPCVNNSGTLCYLKDKTIYLGFGMINEVEHHTCDLIMEERERNGAFVDVDDFLKRIPISVEQMRLLVRVGAFRFTGKNKKELLWEIHALIKPQKQKNEELFELRPKTWKFPTLNESPIDEAFDEIELLGFSLCSPFELLKDKITSKLLSKQLGSCVNKEVCIVGYLITVKTTYTSKGDKMYFGTFIDTEGAWIDTVHFPPSARAYPFIGPGCYELKGKVVEEYDFISIEVNAMKRLSVIDRERMPEESMIIKNPQPE